MNGHFIFEGVPIKFEDAQDRKEAFEIAFSIWEVMPLEERVTTSYDDWSKGFVTGLLVARTAQSFAESD